MTGGGGILYNMQISYKAAAAHIIAYDPRRRGVCSRVRRIDAREYTLGIYTRCTGRAEISSSEGLRPRQPNELIRLRDVMYTTVPERDRHTAADIIDVTVTHREISL